MSSSTTDQAQVDGTADERKGKRIHFGKSLYFAYGSNMWHEQMAKRCPDAKFLGIARLRGYRWMINKRGYATIEKLDPSLLPEADSGAGVGDSRTDPGSASDPEKQKDESEDEVEDDEEEYTAEDEDGTEVEMENVDHKTTVWGAVWLLGPEDEARLDKDEGVPYAYRKRDIDGIEFWHGSNPKLGKPVTASMLVYIDFWYNTDGTAPKPEYHHRMLMAIRDGLEAGIPEGYFESVLRKWITPEAPELDKVKDEPRRRSQQKNSLHDVGPK